MDNTYYILANKEMTIDRFHICTWELPRESSYIEFGLEFSIDMFNNTNTIDFHISIPDVDNSDSVQCLLENLSNLDNGRFIFNDVVTGIENIGNDSRDGAILRFDNRDNLTLLPCHIILSDGILCLKIKKPNKPEGKLYCRVLIELKKKTIAINKNGIAQTTYIYDFKINENRNLPQKVYDLKTSNDLKICKIKRLFCLHAFPDSFNFSFVDSTKLKNIRKLESAAFQKYLPQIRGINKDGYNIMFLKDDDSDGKESYSLFSVCTEETIGSKQIAFAIGANILCTLLFAFSSLEFNKPSLKWYCQIPWEYWTALGIVIILCIYILNPLKKLNK